jgi:hypothetical protein
MLHTISGLFGHGVAVWQLGRLLAREPKRLGQNLPGLLIGKKFVAGLRELCQAELLHTAYTMYTKE